MPHRPTYLYTPPMIRCPVGDPVPCSGCGVDTWDVYADGAWHECCRLWRAELAAGRRCPACVAAEGRPRVRPVRSEDDSDAYADATWHGSPELEFCAEPGCGLTCPPGSARCWAHTDLGGQ